MIKVEVNNHEIALNVNGRLREIIFEHAIFTKSLYDQIRKTSPEDAEDIAKMWTDPEYWKMIIEHDENEGREGETLRWTMKL